ncbi:CYTOCHROME P450 71D10 [Salix viminalis]|uniref:CYTOCHROME P450 71D10 n=1 Tax=Salix viminalis TaxID=40686 RepID=A0A9Q0U6L1_SALVM|nr:CYTOCHROME P450 71D10 [Salix viminalis]
MHGQLEEIPFHRNEVEKFYPERFIDVSADFKGSSFEFIPFGAGKRMCPGMSFAIANIEFTLAQMLYHFDRNPADGLKPENLDMIEVSWWGHLKENEVRVDSQFISLTRRIKIAKLL